jgi:hypothetical protein
MSSIGALSLWIPVRRPTLIALDLPLAFLIGITSKRKKLLTYTLEITKSKLEQLCSARLIHGDQKTPTRGLISLLAPIKHVISHLKLINMRRFAS